MTKALDATAKYEDGPHNKRIKTGVRGWNWMRRNWLVF